MSLPNFLIVGAAKAGTTALYYYLQQHPDIYFPKLKEPKYFSSSLISLPHNGPGDKTVDRYTIKTWENYVKLFNNHNAQKLIGEASPDYLFYHNKTAPHIFNKLGDIPIIIILRNPVLRAYSAFSYLVRDNREKEDFKTALNLENWRLSKNYDFIWALKKGGEYYAQVNTFLKTFSKVKIIIFEEFVQNPNQVLSEIFNFLKINNDIQIDTSVQHNPSGVPKNVFSKLILSRNNYFSLFIRETAKKIIPRNYLESFASKNLNKKNISQEEYIYLQEYFNNDINKLEKLIKKDLSVWLKK